MRGQGEILGAVHSLFGLLLLFAPLPSGKLLSGFIYKTLPTSQGFLIVFLHQDFVLGY